MNKIDTQWLPNIPARLARRLAPFTPYRDGWCRWYKGRSRHICGRKTPLEEIEDRWKDKVKEIDDADAAAYTISHRAKTGQLTLIEAIARFYEYLDHRLTSEDNPIAKSTRLDYVKHLNTFGKIVGSNREIASLGQADFKRFADSLAGCAPSTKARHVAYAQAFFNWCVDEGFLQRAPLYGRFFVKPAHQVGRDVRFGQAKSYTPEQLAKLWKAATHTERAWIALGINGALDNADIAFMPLPTAGGVLDLDARLIDYRRRKRGRIRRIIPLRHETVAIIRHYIKRHRPEPATEEAKGLLFLTLSGLPLQHETAKCRIFDSMTCAWRDLMIRAGIRMAYATGKDAVGPKRRQRGSASGQGFRALRTTFPNLAPRGFRDEVEIIMGHMNKGGILSENYVEQYGIDGLHELVDAVWQHAFSVLRKAPSPASQEPAGESSSPSSAVENTFRANQAERTVHRDPVPRGPR